MMRKTRFGSNGSIKIKVLVWILFGMALAGCLAWGVSGGRQKSTIAINPGTGMRAEAASSRETIRKVLSESWAFYKARFLVDGAHVVSNTYGGTISEGQSYALLKAVWMNDPETFKRVWSWTKFNMRRPHDYLLGWRWGDGEFGTSKGLMELDNAADADQDIAYALLLAGEQWQQPAYTRDGLNIVRDLWRLNVQELDGQYYLIPGTWEGFKQEYLTLDPSYFAPYVYRKFAQYDKTHAEGWIALADNIYDTLDACTNLTRSKLPPNWCAIKWKDDGRGARIIFSDRQGEGSRDFSYDAFRVYWRMAMDAKLSPSPGRDRARQYLQTHPFLLQYWQKQGMMPEGFTAEGQPRTRETSGFAMGPVLVLSHFQNPAQDETLYLKMLDPHYNPDGYWFNDYNDFLHSVIWLHLYAVSL
jgi:endoglucanase